MIRAFLLLWLLPFCQMAVLEQTAAVEIGSTEVKCSFTLSYTPPSGPVDLKKSKLSCKSKKLLKKSGYKLISEDETQPCTFTLSFVVKGGKGKFSKADVACTTEPSPSPAPAPAPSPAPSPSPVVNEMDSLLVSTGIFECYECMNEFVPQCILHCIPDPFNKDCVGCLIRFA